MAKKEKKYPAHQIARKKILDDQKSPTPTRGGLTFFNKTRRANFCGEKKYNEAFQGDYI